MGALCQGLLPACLQLFQSVFANRFQHPRTAIHRSLARPAAAGSCPPWMPCRRAGPNRDRFWCRIQLPRLPDCIRPRTPIIFGKASARHRSEGRSSSRLRPEESVALSAGLARRPSIAARPRLCQACQHGRGERTLDPHGPGEPSIARGQTSNPNRVQIHGDGGRRFVVKFKIWLGKRDGAGALATRHSATAV